MRLDTLPEHKLNFDPDIADLDACSWYSHWLWNVRYAKLGHEAGRVFFNGETPPCTLTSQAGCLTHSIIGLFLLCHSSYVHLLNPHASMNKRPRR